MQHTPELSINERLRRLERIMTNELPIMTVTHVSPYNVIPPSQKNLRGTDKCGFKYKSYNSFDSSYQADDENSHMDIENKFANCRLQEKMGRKLQFE